MTDYKRGLQGNVASGKGGALGVRKTGRSPAVPKKRAEKKDWPLWITHRGGPFLIHTVADCDPAGAMGCNNSQENLIEQGFFPCPKCNKGGAS